MNSAQSRMNAAASTGDAAGASGWRDRLRRFGGPFVIAVIGVIMMGWTWGTWPDALIDFGRELYVPWRLSEGDVIHRDIAHLGGPLSQYFNAGLFRVFGTGLLTLVVANAIIAALVAALLYRLLVETAGVLAATVGGVVFVTLFACLQLTSVGNYNFLAPYAHEMTHGCALSLLVVWCLGRYGRAGRRGWLIAAGTALGLVFLTKVEIFLAAAAAAAVGAALAGGWRAVAVVVLAALPPIAAAIALLAIPLGIAEGCAAVFAPWTFIADDAVRELRFYRSSMGTLDVPASLGMLAAMTGWFAAVFIPAAGVALVARRPRVALPLAVVAAGAVVWVLRAVPEPGRWFQIGRPLPLFMIAVAVLSFVGWRRAGRGDAARGHALRLALAVFAGALLLKMVLNARLHHYGFVLAMPATVLTVAALVEWIPAAIARRGGGAAVFRAVSLAALAVAIAAHLGVAEQRYRAKRYEIGTGADRFLVGARGQRVIEALDGIVTRLGPDETLAVVPEGVMINYLLRRRNPTPYINFMPPEFVLFGEREILDAFAADPPDLVVVAAKNTREYGVGDFGAGYGKAFWTWLMRNYTVVERREDAPQPIWIMTPNPR
jgi:hypothetical protein